jgi:hypothetical protein
MNDLSLKKNRGVKGTLYEKKLFEQYPNLKVQTFNSPDEMLTEAKRGGIDAMVSAQEYLNARLIQSNLQTSFYQLKNVTFPKPVYSLTKKGNIQLIEQIKEGFNDIRKAIYTTNTIESLNSVIRKAVKNRKVFPNDDSAKKVIYLAITHASKKWTMPIRNWKSALNRFMIEFEDRISDYI